MHMKRLSLTILLILSLFTAFAENLSSISVEYFGDIGCSHFDLFEEKILPEAEASAGFSADVEYINVLAKSGFERCETRLAEMGYEFRFSPVMIIGNNVYQGDSAVEKGILEELIYAAEHGAYQPKQETEIPVQKEITLAFLPVFLAGLVDGVNPCAFATMLFFISWISLRGGSRKRMVLAGSGFIAGVFAAYLLIGLGLFTIFEAAQNLTLLRTVIRYLFSSAALVLAFLSLRDAFLIQNTGKSESMKLQLPSAVKKRIHGVIRETDMNKGAVLLFSALFITGIIVSLLELACTGQIYFPTIAYMVQSGSGGNAILWLLLYNIAFILPLLVLFVFALTGVSQKNLAGFFTRHIIKGKVAGALLFLMLAVIIWISG